MNPITTAYKKRKEEFEEKFIDSVKNLNGGIAYTELKYGEQTDVDELLASQKSDILAVIEGVEKWAEKNKKIKDTPRSLIKFDHTVEYFTGYGNDGDVNYNEALSDLLRFLKEAKEEINQDK